MSNPNPNRWKSKVLSPPTCHYPVVPTFRWVSKRRQTPGGRWAGLRGTWFSFSGPVFLLPLESMDMQARPKWGEKHKWNYLAFTKLIKRSRGRKVIWPLFSKLRIAPLLSSKGYSSSLVFFPQRTIGVEGTRPSPTHTPLFHGFFFSAQELWGVGEF